MYFNADEFWQLIPEDKSKYKTKIQEALNLLVILDDNNIVAKVSDWYTEASAVIQGWEASHEPGELDEQMFKIYHNTVPYVLAMPATPNHSPVKGMEMGWPETRTMVNGEKKVFFRTYDNSIWRQSDRNITIPMKGE